MWEGAEREDGQVVVIQGKSVKVWFKEIITNPRKSIIFGCILMTMGIILSYFVLKRNELKKIRIILNAKQLRIEQERIESMI